MATSYSTQVAAPPQVAPVAPAQTNTGSTIGDVIGGLDFALRAYSSHKQQNLQKQMYALDLESQQGFNTGVLAAQELNSRLLQIEDPTQRKMEKLKFEQSLYAQNKDNPYATQGYHSAMSESGIKTGGQVVEDAAIAKREAAAVQEQEYQDIGTNVIVARLIEDGTPEDQIQNQLAAFTPDQIRNAAIFTEGADLIAAQKVKQNAAAAAQLSLQAQKRDVAGQESADKVALAFNKFQIETKTELDITLNSFLTAKTDKERIDAQVTLRNSLAQANQKATAWYKALPDDQKLQLDSSAAFTELQKTFSVLQAMTDPNLVSGVNSAYEKAMLTAIQGGWASSMSEDQIVTALSLMAGVTPDSIIAGRAVKGSLGLITPKKGEPAGKYYKFSGAPASGTNTPYVKTLVTGKTQEAEDTDKLMQALDGSVVNSDSLLGLSTTAAPIEKAIQVPIQMTNNMANPSINTHNKETMEDITSWFERLTKEGYGGGYIERVHGDAGDIVGQNLDRYVKNTLVPSLQFRMDPSVYGKLNMKLLDGNVIFETKGGSETHIRGGGGIVRVAPEVRQVLQQGTNDLNRYIDIASKALNLPPEYFHQIIFNTQIDNKKNK